MDGMDGMVIVIETEMEMVMGGYPRPGTVLRFRVGREGQCKVGFGGATWRGQDGIERDWRGKETVGGASNGGVPCCLFAPSVLAGITYGVHSIVGLACFFLPQKRSVRALHRPTTYLLGGHLPALRDICCGAADVSSFLCSLRLAGETGCEWSINASRHLWFVRGLRDNLKSSSAWKDRVLPKPGVLGGHTIPATYYLLAYLPTELLELLTIYRQKPTSYLRYLVEISVACQGNPTWI
ncbi:hypothetical protein F4808DRAFT_103762 [Astrocystis sublimbata]|nr:hypothetical protein F4808DRAFT_103762 [Astrocystis sublimbata]